MNFDTVYDYYHYTTGAERWLGASNSSIGGTTQNLFSTSSTGVTPQNLFTRGLVKETPVYTGCDISIRKEEQELKIIDHTYKNGKTIIKWNDGTTTVCHGNPETSDAYTGFMIALAKKFMGNKNKANNLADYWCVKVPKKRKEAERKALEEKIVDARRAEKRKKRREAYRRKIAAIRLKEQYEAKKLASELYNIPIDEL